MKVTIEILDPPRLNATEGRLLDLHSALNAMQAVYGELYLIARAHPEKQGRLQGYCDAITALGKRAGQDSRPHHFLREVLKVADPLEADLLEIESGQDPGALRGSRSTEALKTILRVVRVRVGELCERDRVRHCWAPEPIDHFVGKLTQFFTAVEKHANGRFGVAYDRSTQGANDYLIEIRVESRLGGVLFIPPEFSDLVRDLCANARKYTAPGGILTLHLTQQTDRIGGIVRDTGIGIPADEIEQVVQFGRRGSNVGEIRTLGGGFGLTKAVALVKGWGGRFWIASEVGVGTEVRFEIPTPLGNGFADGI